MVFPLNTRAQTAATAASRDIRDKKRPGPDPSPLPFVPFFLTPSSHSIVHFIDRKQLTIDEMT